MTAKAIRLNDTAREALMTGINALADAVRVTIGPRGRNVVIEKGFGAPRSTKDGITVADDIELEDRLQNVGARMLREIARRTNDEAGDGTTSAIVLGQAIAREGMKAVTAGLDPMDVKRGVDKAVASAQAYIGTLSRPVHSHEAILHVGMIASNGDEEVAELLADAFERAGSDGLVTVEEGQTLATELDMVEGLRVDRGYISSHFVTDAERSLCELERPRVLLHDGKIVALQPLVPLLESVAREGVPLLIVAEAVEDEALAGLIVNKLRGGLRVAAIKAPGFGESRRELLDDMAALTGATVVRAEAGLKLDSVTLGDLGLAARVRIGKDESVLIGSGERQRAVAERMAHLRAEHDRTDNEHEQQKLQSRIAALAGGVAVLRIGGTSEAAVKERKDRAEDAVNALRAAVADGVVPGGGIALLLAAANSVRGLRPKSRAERAGVVAVRRALAAPAQQIADNAGLRGTWAVTRVLEGNRPDHGIDARTGELVDLFAAGIIDPTRVVKSALRNAASVAGLLVTTEALIADEPDEQRAKQGMAAAG